MKHGRRKVLALLAAAWGAALGSARALASPLGRGSGGGAVEADPLRLLGAWVDTLIPADGRSPAASEVGCERLLRRQAQSIESARRLLIGGCRWLERQSAAGPRTFAELPEPERERIAALAANAPPGSLPRLFFGFTRSEVFHHYYAQPESWGALGFAGPPQPNGFPDHAEPWSAPPR